MKYIFLSQQFYTDYDSKQFPEIAHKVNRPYIMLLVQIEDVTFAVPFRSHITHKNAFITDAQNNCGIDYTKAVIITKSIYVIDSVKGQPIKIRPNEHKALLGKKYELVKSFTKYVKDYKRAVKNKVHTKVNAYKFSTLQYFHKELGLETQAERVLKSHQEGKTIREIADILQISHHCVKAILCVVLKSVS